MTAERDPYSVLGVSPDSPDEVIQAARKALLLKYHPDRFRGDPKEAARRSAEINTAYEVVGNPKRRAKYDEESSVLDAEIEEAPDWREPPPPPPPPPRNDKQKRDPPTDPPDAGDGVEVWKRAGSSGGWIVPASALGIVLAFVLFASGVLSPHRQPEPAQSNDMMASSTSPANVSNSVEPVTNSPGASATAPETEADPAARLNPAQLTAFHSDTSAALSNAGAGRCWDADKWLSRAGSSYVLNGWERLESHSRDAELVNFIAGLWQEYRTASDAMNACAQRQYASGRTHYTGDFSQGLASIIAAANKGDCTTANATLALMTQSLNNSPEFYRIEVGDGQPLAGPYSRAESAARLCRPVSGQAEITVTGYRSQDPTNDVRDAPAQPVVKTFTVQRAGPQ